VITGNEVCIACQFSMICMTVWGPTQMFPEKTNIHTGPDDEAYFFKCTHCDKKLVSLPSPEIIPGRSDRVDYIVSDDCPRINDDGTCVACYYVEQKDGDHDGSE
jgi:hypothetical protein